MSNNNNRIIIAIDGYSSCGKSTVAKEVARQLNYIYIDTGAMYRAVTLYCLRNGIIDKGVINIGELEKQLHQIDVLFKYNPATDHNDIWLRTDDHGQQQTWLNGENVEEEIRQLTVSQNVSQVAAIPGVRKLLVSLQQAMGRDKGIVMDGRDIGTVVFPQAELKIFMTARADVRAQRRFDELVAKGEKVSYDQILENVTSRDHFDETRSESPLRRADDALLLDNSFISREEQMNWVLEQVNRRTGNDGLL